MQYTRHDTLVKLKAPNIYQQDLIVGIGKLMFNCIIDTYIMVYATQQNMISKYFYILHATCIDLEQSKKNV